MPPPQHPVGPYEPDTVFDDERCRQRIAVLTQAPNALEAAVAGLTDAQFDTRYVNWTVRQIVHHLADSHCHSYLRFKWTLTEERPTVKGYEEDRWVALDDSRTGDIAAPLALLRATHARWLQLLHRLTPEQFARTFLHSQSGEEIALFRALSYYAWHSRHHTGQILWLREQHGWG